MSVSESEAFEAGMSLPADARRRLALRLLESVNPDEASDKAAESWLRTEVVAAYDEIKADPSIGIPAEDVRAEFEAKWAARP
jgi:Putative addiction module component